MVTSENISVFPDNFKSWEVALGVIHKCYIITIPLYPLPLSPWCHLWTTLMLLAVAPLEVPFTNNYKINIICYCDQSVNPNGLYQADYTRGFQTLLASDPKNWFLKSWDPLLLACHPDSHYFNGKSHNNNSLLAYFGKVWWSYFDIWRP